MYNVSDSLLFLGCARTAARDVIDLNEDMDLESKVYLKNFVMNEATDFQIMSLLMNHEIP